MTFNLTCCGETLPIKTEKVCVICPDGKKSIPNGQSLNEYDPCPKCGVEFTVHKYLCTPDFSKVLHNTIPDYAEIPDFEIECDCGNIITRSPHTLSSYSIRLDNKLTTEYYFICDVCHTAYWIRLQLTTPYRYPTTEKKHILHTRKWFQDHWDFDPETTPLTPTLRPSKIATIPPRKLWDTFDMIGFVPKDRAIMNNSAGEPATIVESNHLIFYKKERKMLDSIGFAPRDKVVTEKEALTIIKKLCRHFKIPRVPNVRFYGNRDSGNCGYEIRLCHKPSFEVIIHELAHWHNRVKGISTGHDKKFTKTDKKFAKYVMKMNYWIKDDPDNPFPDTQLVSNGELK